MSNNIEFDLILKDKQFQQAAAKAAAGVDKISANVEGLEASLAKTGKRSSSVFSTRNILKFSGALIGVQTAMAAVSKATRFLTSEVSESIKTFADYEKSMLAVKTLLDESALGGRTAEQVFASMGQEMSTVLRTIPVDAQSATKALFDITSAQIDATQATNVLTAASKLAVAGNTEVATATRGIIKSLVSYGIEASKAGEVAAKFFTAQKLGLTTVEELTKGIELVAPQAAQLGISLDEVLSTIVGTTRGALNTNKAFIGLAAAMKSVINPTEEAKALAKELNLEFDVQSLKTRKLAGFYQYLNETVGGNVEAMTTLFGSARALRQVMSASTESGQKGIVQTLKQLQNSAQNGVVFNKAYEDSVAGLANQFQLFGNKVDEVWKGIITQVAPALTRFLTEVGTSLDRALAALQNPAVQADIRNIAEAFASFSKYIFDAILNIETITQKLVTLVNVIRSINDITNFISNVSTLDIKQFIIYISALSRLRDEQKRLQASGDLLGAAKAGSDITRLQDKLEQLKNGLKDPDLKLDLKGPQEAWEFTGEVKRAAVEAKERVEKQAREAAELEVQLAKDAEARKRKIQLEEQKARHEKYIKELGRQLKRISSMTEDAGLSDLQATERSYQEDLKLLEAAHANKLLLDKDYLSQLDQLKQYYADKEDDIRASSFNKATEETDKLLDKYRSSKMTELEILENTYDQQILKTKEAAQQGILTAFEAEEIVAELKKAKADEVAEYLVSSNRDANDQIVANTLSALGAIGNQLVTGQQAQKGVREAGVAVDEAKAAKQAAVFDPQNTRVFEEQIASTEALIATYKNAKSNLKESQFNASDAWIKKQTKLYEAEIDKRERILSQQKELLKTASTSNATRQAALDKSSENLASATETFNAAQEARDQAAQAALVSGAAAVANVVVPGLGVAVQPFLTAMLGSPEDAKQFIEAIIDQIPLFIDALVANIPVIVEALAEASPTIALALASAVAETFANPVWQAKLAWGVFTAFLNGLSLAVEKIFNGFDNIVVPAWRSAIDDVTSYFSEKWNAVIDKIKSIFSGGAVASAGGTILSEAGSFLGIGAATGGFVTGVGTKDTVPAVLTPGELVIDRTTGPRLNAFMDNYQEGGAKPASSGQSEFLLAQILAELVKPTKASATVEFNGDTLADIILNLNRRGARLSP